MQKNPNNRLLWKVWFQKQHFVIVLILIIKFKLEHRKQRSLERKLIRLYQLSLACPLPTIQLHGLYQAEFTLWQSRFKDSTSNRHSADGYKAIICTVLHSHRPSLEGTLKTPGSENWSTHSHLPRLWGVMLKLVAFNSTAGHSCKADRLANGKIIWKPYSGPSVKGQDFRKKAPLQLFLFFVAMGLASEDSVAGLKL